MWRFIEMSGPTTAEKAIELAQNVQDQAHRVMHLVKGVEEALVDATSRDDSEEGQKARSEGIDRAMVFADLAREIAVALRDRAELAELEINIIAQTGAPALGAS